MHELARACVCLVLHVCVCVCQNSPLTSLSLLQKSTVTMAASSMVFRWLCPLCALADVAGVTQTCSARHRVRSGQSVNGTGVWFRRSTDCARCEAALKTSTLALTQSNVRALISSSASFATLPLKCRPRKRAVSKTNALMRDEEGDKENDAPQLRDLCDNDVSKDQTPPKVTPSRFVSCCAACVVAPFDSLFS